MWDHEFDDDDSDEEFLGFEESDVDDDEDVYDEMDPLFVVSESSDEEWSEVENNDTVPISARIVQPALSPAATNNANTDAGNDDNSAPADDGDDEVPLIQLLRKNPDAPVWLRTVDGSHQKQIPLTAMGRTTLKSKLCQDGIKPKDAKPIDIYRYIHSY